MVAVVEPTRLARNRRPKMNLAKHPETIGPRRYFESERAVSNFLYDAGYRNRGEAMTDRYPWHHLDGTVHADARFNSYGFFVEYRAID